MLREKFLFYKLLKLDDDEQKTVGFIFVTGSVRIFIDNRKFIADSLCSFLSLEKSVFPESSVCIQSISGLSHSFASSSNTCTCSTADNRKYVGFMIARFSSSWKMCWTAGGQTGSEFRCNRVERLWFVSKRTFQ